MNKGLYLLEEEIIQHPELDKLNPYAVNSFRIVTLVKDNKAYILANALRINIDDAIAIGCSDAYMRLNEDGKICSRVVDDVANVYTEHPIAKIKFDTVTVPYVKEAFDMALKAALYYMGCYGIGVSRTVATIYEESVLKDENGKVQGFVLPESVAPYKIQIIPKMDNEEKVKEANELYCTLLNNGIEAILDDRNLNSIGAKIKDCKILGTPYMAVLGDKVKSGEVELENVRTGEKEIISIEKLLNKFSK